MQPMTSLHTVLDCEALLTLVTSKWPNTAQQQQQQHFFFFLFFSLELMAPVNHLDFLPHVCQIYQMGSLWQCAAAPNVNVMLLDHLLTSLPRGWSPWTNLSIIIFNNYWSSSCKRTWVFFTSFTLLTPLWYGVIQLCLLHSCWWLCLCYFQFSPVAPCLKCMSFLESAIYNPRFSSTEQMWNDTQIRSWSNGTFLL